MDYLKKLARLENKLHMIISVFTIVYLLFFGSTSHAEATDSVKRVLILHWQNAYEEIPTIMDKSIRSTLESDKSVTIEYYTEYLNFSQFANAEIQEATIKLFKLKYENMNLDVIITTELTDYFFVVEHREELFPDVPLVFSGLNESIETSLGIPPNSTGNFKVTDVVPTIELIKKMQPDLENIVFVLGSGQAEASYYRLIKNSMVRYADDFNSSYTIDMTFEEIKDLLKQLPPHTVVAYTGMYMDSKGKGLNPGEALASLSENTAAPIFIFSDAFINNKVVGGNLFSYEMTGKDLAERALAIIHGKKAEDLPVTTLENVYTFNWSELQKWNIKLDTLPKGSVILGNTGAVKNQFGIKVFYFLFGSLFISVLLIIKRNLKR